MRNNSARPNALVQFAARLVQRAFGELCTPDAVNLFRLAQSRRIHTLELRPLLADGCVFVQDDGFTVQLYDKKTEVLRLHDQLASRRLTVKQRFTFAHEIAHTLAYDSSIVPPRIRPEVLRSIEGTGARTRGKLGELLPSCGRLHACTTKKPPARKDSRAMGNHRFT
jgi:hypothetical protein